VKKKIASPSRLQRLRNTDPILFEHIVEAISKEIEKGLLTDEEIRQIGRTTCDSAMISGVKAVAQAQLQKILALLK